MCGGLIMNNNNISLRATIFILFSVIIGMTIYDKYTTSKSIPITCSADHVTLSGKHYNKASINSLTCNGQVITMKNLRVGRLVNKSNNRVLGMDKR